MKYFQYLITILFFLLGSIAYGQLYDLAQWNDFDSQIHDGVFVESLLTNQINGFEGTNCHGYAFFKAYGLDFPDAEYVIGDVVNPEGVVALIDNDELNTCLKEDATHVIYYRWGDGTWPDLTDITRLYHSAIVSQFDCLPFAGQDYVQSRNGMNPLAVINKVDLYEPTENHIPIYFKYTPDSGSLVPPDSQPACPASVLSCIATTLNPLQCHDDNDGAISVQHSSDAGATHTYGWSNGAYTPTIEDLSAGTYSVIVTEYPSNETCTSSVTLDNPPALVQGVSSTPHGSAFCFTSKWGTVFGNGSATITLNNPSSNVSYLWDGYARYQTTQTADGLCFGTYTCTITHNITGCTEQVVVIVDALKNESNSTAKIGKVINKYSDSDVLIQLYQTDAPTNVIVRNISGQIVYSKQSSDESFSINTSGYTSGIYLVELTIMGYSQFTKVMVP